MRRKPRRWIGVDGEGVGREPHRYVLLACSDGDFIQNRRGLSTVECLEFLLTLGTRDARVAGYYLGYDWTKILTDMIRTPDGRKGIHALFRPELRARARSFERVPYKRYDLHYLAGAMWIRDTKDERQVTIWDLGKYYQGPFCNVDANGHLSGCLPDWNIRPDVQEQIADMKRKRSAFKWRDLPRVRQYCIDECEALAEFAGKLEVAHESAGIKPRAYYGPGSTAGVLLKRHDIGESRGIIPPIMLEAIATAFIGGRAEIGRKGYVPGPIHGWDISSAYPYHASQLPCLEHGRWERVTRERALRGRNVVHALVRGHIRDCRGAWAPLPIRLPKGSIVFPRTGASGWWWRDEWLAAREGWGDGVEFECAYVLRRECSCKPFAFVPELFEHRLRVGKETGEGKVIKLALNSIFGKLAQSVGSAQYASRVWAGMITSGTRAQVLRLMLAHKRLESVLMVATDGLFSTECPRGAASKTIQLGGWEHKTYESITLVRPGMYWLGQDKLRARGLGREALEAGKPLLEHALAHDLERVKLPPRTHFGGAKQTVLMHRAGVKVSDQYGQWFAKPSNVSLKPGPKRAEDWMPPALDDVESTPYGVRSTRAAAATADFLQAMREYFY